MQQKPYRNTNIEFSNRATGYTRRPVADVRARYKTTKPTSHTNAVSEVKVVKTPIRPKISQSVHLKPKSQVAPTHKIKIIGDVKPANNNRPVQKQFTVPVVPSTVSKRHIQHIESIPTLPTPKKGIKHKVARKLRIKSKKQVSGIALSAFAILLLIVGIGVNVHSFTVSKKIEAQAAATDNSGNSENGRPDETKGYSENQPNTASINSYKVAADLPRILQIPSLGTLARIKRVGVDDKNQVGSPQNVFDVAWYDGSSKPGQPGAAFIDGHVLGPTRGGIFANLKNIKIGASITINMGDNKEYNYKVAATEVSQAETVDMNKMLRSYDPSKQGLNLMTCNGTYLKDKKTYDKRYRVYAVREN
ncbi:MAG: class F sortase [Candidatus Saccharimonadales bacterium]